MPTTQWTIDPNHSDVSFRVKHMMISTVSGHFENFDAMMESDGNDFTNAKINVSIDINSINTKNTDRDNHLKSHDFFDADKFPKMTFSARTFNGQKLIGDLTIRGITKEVELDVDSNGVAVDPYEQTKAGFEATGNINRKDFGLNWSAITEAGNIVVSDKVKIIIDAQFIQKN